MADTDLISRLRDDNTIGCNDDGTIRNIELCGEAADRIAALEGGLRDLVTLLKDTGFHNSIEMAAARKLIRHEGWTEAGHAWLDEKENNLPPCKVCGAPAGLDCRTIQGRMPPCFGRETDHG